MSFAVIQTVDATLLKSSLAVTGDVSRHFPPCSTPFKIEVLHLVRDVQQTKWHLLLNKWLI